MHECKSLYTRHWRKVNSRRSTPRTVSLGTRQAWKDMGDFNLANDNARFYCANYMILTLSARDIKRWDRAL